MNTDTPLVTVIIPTYNGAKTIERAIDSVLRQTHSNLEIIVVDDYSTDCTTEVISKYHDYKIKLIKHSINKNGSAARNTGVKQAQGEYIAFLDDDDEWFPEKIEHQLNYLKVKESDKWRGVICSYLYLKNSKFKKIIIKKEGDLKKEILSMALPLGAGSTLMIHKSVIDDVGLFNEKYMRNQDVEFVLRYLRKFYLAVVVEPLCKVYGSSGKITGEPFLFTKKRLLKDFKQDIQKFSISVQKKIYARQWLEVAKYYAVSGDVRQAIEYLFKSLYNGVVLSTKYKVLPQKSYFTTLFFCLKKIIRPNSFKAFK